MPHNRPLVILSQLAMAFGGGLILLALFEHHSQGGAVLGRYSLGYAAAMVAAAVLWAAFIAWALIRHFRFQSFGGGQWALLPAGWLDPIIILAAGVFGWVIGPLGNRWALLSDQRLLAGVIVMVAGGLAWAYTFVDHSA